jgi:two-component system alkaline phosphatase synthesis response regulator PhoP
MSTVLLISKSEDRAESIMEQLRPVGWDVIVTTRTDYLEASVAKSLGVVLLDLIDEPHSAYDCDVETAIHVVKSDMRFSKIPLVIIIKKDTIDRIQAVTQIHEVVVCPCDPMEISLRLKFALRDNNTVSQEILKIGAMVIYPLGYEVTIGGKTVPLTYKEFELLRLLAENNGKVYTRRVLVSKIWTDRPNGMRTVDVHIRRLRAKLGIYGDLITTVRGVGYRFKLQLPREI